MQDLTKTNGGEERKCYREQSSSENDQVREMRTEGRGALVDRPAVSMHVVGAS